MKKKDWHKLALSYLANIVFFALIIVTYRESFYYKDFLRPDTQNALLWMFVAYAVLAIPMELALPANMRRLESKGLIAFRVLFRYLSQGFVFLRTSLHHHPKPPSISKEEKNSILFLLVKIFFLPIMINFCFGNFHNIQYYLSQISTTNNLHIMLLYGFFPMIVAALYFIDTLVFIFGYSIEYPVLNNTIRSVEPTLLGWVVALLCYPPFNTLTDNYFIWIPDTLSRVSSLVATYGIHISAIFLLWVYVWASIALGSRASNLTNRGIVTWGPYAYVRHPAYICKVIGWWLLSISFFLTPDKPLFFGIISMSFTTFLYFVRAITEERHLLQDPDYQEYCKNVRWRFIPYVL